MNDNVSNFLRAILVDTMSGLLPPNRWFDDPEVHSIWVSVFRVFRVPYDTQVVQVGRFDAGQISAALTNLNLPYPDLEFGFNPVPDGSVEPRGGLLGWNTTNRGNLLVLMTPMKSYVPDLDPEVEVRYRIDAARAVIVAILGLNAAYEQICEFSIDTNTSTISRRSPAMENPLFHTTPNVTDESSWGLIQTILEGIDSLEVPIQNRVRLALRWYQRALGEQRVHKVGGSNVDSLINYWIALETLVRVGEQRVGGRLIKSLSDIHNLSTQEIGQTFPISKIYELRKKVVHQGDLSLTIRFELQQFLSDVFVDILALQIMDLSISPRTQKYLDGRANSYLTPATTEEMKA